MTEANDVWKDPGLVAHFIARVRGGVPLAAEQIDAMLRVIAARPQSVRNFADLGCGGGVLAAALLAQHPQAQATLVDFSAPMMQAARAELAAHRPAPHFVVADLASAAWTATVAARAPFDVIVSGYAIHHLLHERKRALYEEIFALLAPGGTFINVEHVASRTPWLEAVWNEMVVDSLHAFRQQHGSLESRAAVAQTYAERPDKAANILAPVETQCDWLRQIGLIDVDCYFKVFELAVFGGRKSVDA